MASNSAGSKHGGKASMEYGVVRKYFGSLVNISQHSLCPVANELFSEELINKFEHTKATDSNQLPYGRATEVMNSVLAKIEGNSSCFAKFVNALRMSELNDMAKDMETSLSEMKANILTMPFSEPSGPTEDTDSSLVQLLNKTTASATSSSCDTLPLQNENPENKIKPSESGSIATLSASSVFPRLKSPRHSTSDMDMQYPCKPRYQLTSGCSSLSVYEASHIVGNDIMACCVKPEQFVAHNPLVDALSGSLHSSIKLVKIQSSSSPYSGSPLPPLHEDYEAENFKSPHTKKENVFDELEVSIRGTTNKHPIPRANSLSSTCVCHVEIQFLQTKLDRRMDEIQRLKKEIMELEEHYKEGKQHLFETEQEQAQLKHQREMLRSNIATKGNLIKQLSEEKAAYERENDELKRRCKNAEERQCIAEQMASHRRAEEIRKQGRYDKLQKELWEAESRAQKYKNKMEEKTKEFEQELEKRAQHLTKIACLEKELKTAMQHEAAIKNEYIRIGYEIAQSEALANIEACIAKRNNTACLTLAPKFKVLAERERQAATLANDFARAKEAEKLAEKAKNLIRISKLECQQNDSRINNDHRNEMTALDLMTPDKDIQFFI